MVTLLSCHLHTPPPIISFSQPNRINPNRIRDGFVTLENGMVFEKHSLTCEIILIPTRKLKYYPLIIDD